MEYETHCNDHDLDSLKCLLLDLARQRNLDDVLRLIVEQLSRLSSVALARIWTLGPGDIGEVCPMREECPDHTRCRQLVASAGNPSDESEDWSRVDGQYRRFPLGVRKVGKIASTGEHMELTILNPNAEWLADPQWAARENIRGVIGHPLSFQHEVLGVLFVFLREPPPEEAVIWLRMIADHAAAAMANARAFSEIQQLKRNWNWKTNIFAMKLKRRLETPVT